MKAINGASTAAAIGAIALLATSITAVALAWPNSAVARFIDLAPTSDARAASLVDGAAQTSADLALSQRETMRSLRQAPANPTAWLRLAYIDSRRPEGLGQAGVQAIARSYAAAPYGPDDTGWRLRFAFNHWARLDRPTRLLVLEELRTASSNHAAAVDGLVEAVSDPSGRLALRLALSSKE